MKSKNPFSLRLLVIGTILYLVLDFLFVGILFGSFYESQLKDLVGSDVNLGLAIVVYLLIVAGHQLFVLPRVEKKEDAFYWGAIYGAIIYGVTDLTNLAALKNWPQSLTYLDIAWGMVVNGIIAWFLVKRAFPEKKHS